MSKGDAEFSPRPNTRSSQSRIPPPWRAAGILTQPGCGHSVDVTPNRTEVCKDGSCLVIEQGHISYSQAQPETDVPPVVQPLKK